jgi:hypothetical protein
MGCAGEEARFPGDTDCSPVGTTCPTDGWPLDLPASGTIHFVAEGASAGDGTRTAPWGTIAEAIAVAAPGDTIALGAGTYPETFTLPAGVTLLGACPADTIIDPPPGDITTYGVLLDADSALVNLTVAGQRPGVRGHDGVARLTDVIVRAAIVGVAVTASGTLMADHVVIRDTEPGGEYGIGAFVNQNGRLELRRSLIQRSTSIGVGVDGPTASALLEDVAVSDVAPQAVTGEFGNGVAANGGASVELRRALIERVFGAGVFVRTDSVATIDTIVVRDVEADLFTEGTGFGLGFGMSGTLVADRVHLERTTTAALSAIGFRLDLTVRDLVIEEVSSAPADMRGGVGVLLDSIPNARFERVLATGTKGAAVASVNPGTNVELTDLTLGELAPEESMELGVAAAIEARNGVSLTVRRMRSEGSLGGAIIVTDPDTGLTLEDALLSNNAPTSAGAGGRGISAQLGARFDCTRCEIRDSGEVAIMYLGPGGTSVLRDIRLEATRANPINGAGMGLVALDGAEVDMERFVVADNAVGGIQLFAEPRVVARDGLIANNPVGVNAQSTTLDPADLSDRVLYQDNGLNLDSAELPVPSGGF